MGAGPETGAFPNPLAAAFDSAMVAEVPPPGARVVERQTRQTGWTAHLHPRPFVMVGFHPIAAPRPCGYINRYET